MLKPLGIGPKYIEIVIDEKGETSIEAHGFGAGTSSCRKATEGLEQALGIAGTRRLKTEQKAKQRVGGNK